MNAAGLSDFFLRFRESTVASVDRLGAFFRQFEDEFQKARGVRAANTPHLNVLGVFGLEYAELRHSDALAWFLDSRAEHEQGALFLNVLLNRFQPRLKSSGRYSVRRERHGRVDVAAYARGEFAIFVENKVRHTERDGQVSDMVRSLIQLGSELDISREHRFALFLTDTGAKPTTAPTEDSDGFAVGNLLSLSRVALFEDFASAFLNEPVPSPLLRAFLDSYLNAIRRVRAHLS